MSTMDYIFSRNDGLRRSYRRKRVKPAHATSKHAGDLALQPVEVTDDLEDEGFTSEECASVGMSDHSSRSASSSRHQLQVGSFEDSMPTYAEALWDHVTLSPEEELPFSVGEVIEVKDMSQKDWWYGAVEARSGWFPSAFVRLKANPHDPSDDLILPNLLGNPLPSNSQSPESVLNHRYSCVYPDQDQARNNVVREILTAERDYVKHLKDVIEGYVEKVRKRPEMFPQERVYTIFCNIEEIYQFSRSFLDDLQTFIDTKDPSQSELGTCFLKHKKGFEIYSEYCNNHPLACEELRRLQKDQKYQHFFEACRLLQDMIEIPLEGFLLTPVQKICKYPLQLKELLKYTGPEHPEFRMLQEALDSMRHIALLINERKRKLESIEKISQWQDRVEDWDGADLIEHSSELIHSGEMSKVNSAGWHQDRMFFLFDHQLVYCKKDLLWRDILIYKGRLLLEHCDVFPVQDGKDPIFSTTVRNGIKLFDRSRSKQYLLYCKSPQEKAAWLKAFDNERHRVLQDYALGFHIEDYKRKFMYDRQTSKRDRKKKASIKDFDFPTSPAITATPKLSTKEAIKYAHSQNKSSGLFHFIKRKSSKR